jgi:hypothetical protein
VAETVNYVELYKKLSELQNAVFALEEENHSLKEQLRQRDGERDIGSRLHPRNNAYYYMDDGKMRDGPFCMRCWDVDRKLFRERAGATEGTHYCSECATRRRG